MPSIVKETEEGDIALLIAVREPSADVSGRRNRSFNVPDTWKRYLDNAEHFIVHTKMIMVDLDTCWDYEYYIIL